MASAHTDAVLESAVQDSGWLKVVFINPHVISKHFLSVCLGTGNNTYSASIYSKRSIAARTIP